ncbi:DUF6088 family protein [Aquidulcibacter paucihalophilus]|uniref:DUF6088 family protein n=1 Tax=Aquidulcibacter paucihalophilus TaxID=1978549 RepID=UPI000A18C0EE|nr:DUF6088 family protein [Aquidulcibacter paucihalophilus]
MTDKIIKRVRGKGRGWVFTPKDFLDLGTRASVDMALTRLLNSGSIRRIGRGLYDYPMMHDKLGLLTPDADMIVQAVAVQSGDKVITSGAQAANRLGISTQVPAKSSYATSGASRSKKVAGRTITLKRSRAPILDDASPQANAVLQVLAHLGKINVDSDIIRSLASRLDARDVKALQKARPQMAGWMSDAVLKIEIASNG